MKTPVIFSTLGHALDRLIAAHPSAPRIIPVGQDKPWHPPPQADILLTYMSAWKHAPAKRPAEWPGGLRWVQAASVGVDTFPGWFFDGPVVTCARGVQAPAMAEYVMAVMLAHEKQLWSARVQSPAAWRHLDLGGLGGKSIGIAGFGAVGAEIARRALAFGMTVRVVTRASEVTMAGVQRLGGLRDLVALSDHLVLALPLTADTRHLLNAQLLACAKPTLHVINVGRGGLIADDALLDALARGGIAAATLDVTEPEPLPEGHPFYSHPQIRLTPHAAGFAEDSQSRLVGKIIDNLSRYLASLPLTDSVELARGY